MDSSVTVLMTTYNEEKEIFRTSLESIVNQTLKKIDILIIVDNKNNNDIINCIKKFQQNDNRIKYVINEENLGLPKSLNKGIDLINTQYIARMDADDISVPDRIEKQLEYAKNNSDIDVFGSNIYMIDYDGNQVGKSSNHNYNYKKTKKVMKCLNIFAHPTLFGKTEIFKKYRYRNLRYSQDYDLMCRLLEDNRKVANMDDYLLYYRSPKSKNEDKVVKQKLYFLCVQEKYKKNCLSKTNITEFFEKELEKLNKDRFSKGIKYFDNIMIARRNKQWGMCFTNFIRCFFSTKYQRRQIFSILRYEIF